MSESSKRLERGLKKCEISSSLKNVHFKTSSIERYKVKFKVNKLLM